jgi:glycosyltransferase involved in cell wall biosynthesis
MTAQLFIGITTWNSATFLGHTLGAIRRTTDAQSTRVLVLDNVSTDATVQIARDHGAEVLVRESGQDMALMDLFNASRSEFTLLLHADVILLSERWFDLCRAAMTGNVALVSPEDIGCGPYTRPWGANMPESSFLFFRTKEARKTRRWYTRQRFRLQIPYRAIDFTGPHITYHLPERLRERGLDWRMMNVHPSTRMETPIYTPAFEAPHWNPELAMYDYGLGNFYSLDGVVTHYHNWYERALEAVPDDSDRMLSREAGALPVAFLQTYSRRFLTDLVNGTVRVPTASRPA